MDNCENRRIARRLTRTFPVRCGGQAGYALNISSTGIRLLSRSEVPDQVELELEFEPGRVVAIKGRSVWREPVSGDGACVVGVAFEPRQVEQQSSISTWLDRQFRAA